MFNATKEMININIICNSFANIQSIFLSPVSPDFEEGEPEVPRKHSEHSQYKFFLKSFYFCIGCILLILTHCTLVDAASPKRTIREGNALYLDGDYGASKDKYVEALEKDPESDIVNFNLGTALYKEEDYTAAVEHLQKVLLSEDEALKQKAHYNLGNALYKSGMAREERDMAGAVSDLEKSLSQYESALAINKADADAKHNHEFVQTELVRLKEKQQQQQQKNDQTCPNPKKSDEGADDQEKKDQQQQQDQEQQSQDQESQEEQGEEQEQQQDQQQQQQGEEKKEEPQESQSQQQEGEKKEQQESAQSQKDDYNEQQEQSDAQPQDAKELTAQEAQMMLENYQQTEEPQGLLQILQKSKDPRPVMKDW